jgi:hypothetical protein
LIWFSISATCSVNNKTKGFLVLSVS